jgi:hypothetical protein
MTATIRKKKITVCFGFWMYDFKKNIIETYSFVKAELLMTVTKAAEI